MTKPMPDVEPPDGVVTDGPWTIQTTKQAEWAMRKAAVARAAINAAAEDAAEWEAQIAAWAEKVCAKPLADLKAMEALLERYALERRELDPNAKTITLPSGTVRTKATGPKLEVLNSDAALPWVDTSLKPEARAAVTRRSILVSEIKKYVEIIDVPAVVVFAECGHTEHVPRPWADRLTDDGETIPHPWEAGIAAMCPMCQAPRLVGRLDGVARRVAVDPDDITHEIPGLGVSAPTVTVSVSPGKVEVD